MNPCSSAIGARYYVGRTRRDRMDATPDHGERATARSSSPRTAAASRADDQHLPPCEPTKIVCVHLNYESRRAEFHATLAAAPTYFHKPVSALNAHEGRSCDRRGAGT